MFTQIDGADKELPKAGLEKVLVQQQLAGKAFVNMMRNWAGVIYLSSSPLGLQSLVDALTQPVRVYNKIAVLDMFLEVFNVPVAVGENASQASSQVLQEFSHILHGHDRNQKKILHLELLHAQEKAHASENLLCHYVAILLQAFEHRGVYKALIRICTETEHEEDLHVKAKLLLKKLMFFAAALMPQMPLFPEIIRISTAFAQDADKHQRVRATQLVKELSQVSLVNPLEVQSTDNNVLVSQGQLSTQDISPFFMQSFEYLVSHPLGCPFTMIVSNYITDLKTYYYSEFD